MSEGLEEHKISIELGQSLGRLEWSSVDEVNSWLGELENHWNWLSRTSVQPIMDAWKQIWEPISNCRDYIKQYRMHCEHGENHVVFNDVEQIRNVLDSMLLRCPWLIERSPDFNFVQQIYASGRNREAGFVVCLLMDISLAVDETRPTILKVYPREIATAVFELETYRRGIQGLVEAEQKALKVLLAETTKKLNDTEATRTALAAKTAATEKELAQLTQTYDKFMALAAPVRYWQKKQSKHKWLAIGFGISTVIGMGIVGGMLLSQIRQAGENFKQPVSVASDKASAVASQVIQASSSAWHFDVAVLLLLGTLSFWLLRILVRVFLSHLHLENDAAERVTMAQTYLALLRRGKLPEGDDLKTVLAALFRPSGDGIVKDEGVPPSMVEFLTRMGK